jgi:hypothetical protein
MARMVPKLSEPALEGLKSRAEARFYQACRDQLGPGYLVLHSIPYISRLSGEPRDGEADFVIFTANGGLLVVEIKGGGVSFDPATGRWYSVNASGERNEIKDPFVQATQEKHALIEIIKGHRDWYRLGIKWLFAGHAVFLPNVDRLDALVMPHAPREIIGGRGDLAELEKWLQQVVTFWQGQQQTAQPLGAKGIGLVEDLFCKPREVRPLISAQIRDEEAVRIRLTEEQTRVLRAIGRRRRAAVCGGSGTGKTLLAVDKAKQLAADNCRTLLLCYNRPLADHLKYVIGEQPNLSCMSFHQLCDWKVRTVGPKIGRNLLQEAAEAYPAMDFYDYHLPYALALALDESPDLYDAIIIDEGQDFRDEYWFAVSMLLRGPDSCLFVFYDQNQSVYKRSAKFPIKDEPFLLTNNCRNTDFIHEAAYLYYVGEPVQPPGIQGAPIERIVAASPSAQLDRVHRLVVRLLSEEGVTGEEIAVLVESPNKRYFYDSLGTRPLPKPNRWAPEEYHIPDTILIDTVHRFKGLESAIVILAVPETLDPDTDPETVYVALSRAKSRLYLVGETNVCDRILQRGTVER